MRSLSRRNLLKALAAAPLAVRMPAFANNEKQRLLVLVFLYGGNDNFNTWVPYTDALYRKLRPTLAIPRENVVPVTERHGFNQALSGLLPMWEARELAVLQGIGYKDGTQQHYRDIETAFTGGEGEEFYGEGWVTRALSKAARESGVDAVAFETLDIRQSDPMGPFRGGKLGVVQVYYANELLAKRRFADCVIETNARGKAKLPDAPLPSVALRTEFPADPFGQAVRAAVELASIDRTLPVIHITLNGLDGDKHHSVDCHWEQAKYHNDALKRLGDGLAALRAGLREIGRWDETLVATYDEFGRSPVENEEHGTHHGLASVHFAMGGRVKGGLYGEPPPVQRVHLVGGPAPTLDTRRVWTTVMQRWWERDAAGLFTRRHEALDFLRT